MAKSSGPSVFILPLTLLVLLTAAAVFVVMKNQEERAQAAGAEDTEEFVSPFDDLPPDEVPPPRGTKPSRSTSRNYQAVTEMPDLGGNTLAQSEPWSTAAESGARADELFETAVAAREASEWSTFSKKGAEALDIYEEILESTGAYVEEMTAEHGDRDGNVRGLVRARLFWEERRATLRKLVR